MNRHNQILRWILLAGFSLSLASCYAKGTLKNGEFVGKNVQYHIGAPGPGWQKISIKGADLAWLQKETGSIILINSSCKSSDEAPLEALTAHLLIGMTEQEVIEQKHIPLSDREALESLITVKVDGVPQKMKILVLKKDYCVYDIVFSSPPEAFDALLPAYTSVLDQFSVAGKKL